MIIIIIIISIITHRSSSNTNNNNILIVIIKSYIDSYALKTNQHKRRKLARTFYTVVAGPARRLSLRCCGPRRGKTDAAAIFCMASWSVYNMVCIRLQIRVYITLHIMAYHPYMLGYM